MLYTLRRDILGSVSSVSLPLSFARESASVLGRHLLQAGALRLNLLLFAILLSGCTSGSSSGRFDLGTMETADLGALEMVDLARSANADLAAACPAIHCGDSELVDPATCTCVQRPIVDFIACPYYAPACTVQFYRTPIGQRSKASLTLINRGGSPLHVQSVGIDSPVPFSVSPKGPVTLAPQEQLTVDVAYAPASAAISRATLRVASDALNASATVPIVGATNDASCRSGSDCLYGEVCNSSTALCYDCPLAQPPLCVGGQVQTSTSSSGCPDWICVCPVGKVYDQGVCR